MDIECQGTAPEIYKKLKAKFEAYVKDGKLKQASELKFNDPACEATVVGTGFKSNIKCLDGRIRVDLDLNFLLKPMRGQIEESIKKSISRAMS